MAGSLIKQTRIKTLQQWVLELYDSYRTCQIEYNSSVHLTVAIHLCCCCKSPFFCEAIEWCACIFGSISLNRWI